LRPAENLDLGALLKGLEDEARVAAGQGRGEAVLGEVGDATVDYKDISEKTGPTSTVIGAALVNAVVSRAVEITLEHGFVPKIFSSSNTTAGDVHNTELIASLKNRVTIL